MKRIFGMGGPRQAMRSLQRCRVALVTIAASAAIVATGCGGGDGSISSAPAAPSGPSQASLSATIANTWWGAGWVTGFSWAFGLDITVRESAGMGANGNFLRFDFYDGANGTGTLLERQEAGSNELGRIEPNGSDTANLAVGFNAGAASSVLITISLTDDRGNTTTLTDTVNCCSPWR